MLNYIEDFGNHALAVDDSHQVILLDKGNQNELVLADEDINTLLSDIDESFLRCNDSAIACEILDSKCESLMKAR